MAENQNAEYRKARAALMKRIKRLEAAGYHVDMSAIPVRPSTVRRSDIAALKDLTRQKLLAVANGGTGQVSGRKARAKRPSLSDAEKEYNRALVRLSKNSRVKISDLRKVITPEVVSLEALRKMKTGDLRANFPELEKSGKLKPVKSPGKKSPGKKSSGKKSSGKKSSRAFPATDRELKELLANRQEFADLLPLEFLTKKRISRKKFREYLETLPPDESKQLLAEMKERVEKHKLEEQRKPYTDKETGEIVVPSASGDSRFRVDSETGELIQVSGDGSLPYIVDLYMQRFESLVSNQTVPAYKAAAEELLSSFRYVIEREGQNAAQYLREHGNELLYELLRFCPDWVRYKLIEMADKGYIDPDDFGVIAGNYEIGIDF